MEYIREALPVFRNYLSTIDLGDVLDILIIAFLIYRVLTLVRKTNAMNVVKGILILLAVMWIAELVGLSVITYLIGKTFEMGLIAVIILFQPELRSLLESFGNGRIRNLLREPQFNEKDIERTITQTVVACKDMARDKVGALIVFERDITLDNYIASGTLIQADVSAQLLRNLFYPKAPLHDGAVIVRGSVIESAACVLPLSANNNLSRDLGTRHRAGVGISEVSDAVIVIVSEETGAISLATAGVLKRNLSADMFESLLRKELMPNEGKNGNSGKKFRFEIGGKK